ncbi:unnamed protein product [Rotaria sp. Silwood2]|nr:unnamed protein product [Rotaria sp. Silwood2]
MTNSISIDPANLAAYGQQIGQTFSFVITGGVNGSIYGTNIYTLDSNLATAAVHAGFLCISETKNVTIKILPGQESYTASTQNGVTSSSYGSWKGSYSFVVAMSTSSVTPSNLADYSDKVDETFSFEITGGVNGSIYGTNIYTLDSNLATAAVHAGLLRIGETKNITIKILPGQESYTASTQNGVTSSSYGSWKGSYSFVVAMSPSNVGPSNVADYSDKLAQTFSFVITGNVNGSIYGTNIYTLDSNLATAAVHAGFLRIGETKNITIKILPGQESYTASTQNGVTSSSYGSWKGSYSFISAGGL